MTPLVVGRPCGGGLDVLVALSQVVPGEVTLVWSDREELVAAVSQVLEVGGTTLLVDAQDEAATAHALAHQLQVMGTPQFVCLVAEDEQDAEELAVIAKTLLRTVPLCAVLVVGDERTTKIMRQVLDELELPAPLSPSQLSK